MRYHIFEQTGKYKCFSVSVSSKLMKPEEEVEGTSDLQPVRNTGGNRDLQVVSQEGQEDTIVGLSPQPLESHAVSG